MRENLFDKKVYYVPLYNTTEYHIVSQNEQHIILIFYTGDKKSHK